MSGFMISTITQTEDFSLLFQMLHMCSVPLVLGRKGREKMMEKKGEESKRERKAMEEEKMKRRQERERRT